MCYERHYAGEDTSPTKTTRYLHKDHLGSVVAITTETGTVVESLAYDAWGKRRPASTWQTPAPGVFIAAITLTRGFTMHEHLDQVGLIHMGGRVYDPELGRFLSPDPFVQFPISTQGFNRYAYVSNNPLSYTDPSGYFLKKLMKAAGIGMNFIPGWTLAGNAFIHGFVSGFLASGGDARAGMMGMLSAGIAGEIGLKDLNHFDRALAHGITQGAISAAGGGRFGDGALGAFSGSLLSFIPEAVAGPYGSKDGQIGRMVAAAAVGGTVSKIGGGKFANGAWSAAFVSRFNHDSKFRVSSKGLRWSLDAIGNTEKGQEVISQLESDPLISKVVVGRGSVPGGGLGHTATIENTRNRSLLDVLLGRGPAQTYTVQITINEAADRMFYDVEGNPFRPSTTRVLAHELGHAFARSIARFHPGYDTSIAVLVENAIYLQVRPGAPVRHSTLGHSDAHGGF